MPSGFIEPSSSLANVAAPACLTLSGLGSRATQSSATSPTTSSDVLPPPPPPERGCREMIVSSMAVDSLVWKVMSALRCSPKISGRSTSGKVEMKLRYVSMSPSGGAE